MSAAYDLGQDVEVVGDFRNNGTLYDPTTVKVSVRRPGGKIKTYVYGTDAEVVKDSTGLYYMVITGSLVGVWFYRWFTDTAGQKSADEQRFTILESKATLQA